MINNVRKAEFPFLADWVAISLRWLGLVTVLLIEFKQPEPDIGVLVVTVLLVIWNLALSFLALSNQRLGGHRWINVVVDASASLLFFIFSGGLAGPMAGVGVLALASAAMYYEWRGAIIVTALVTLVETGVMAWFNSSGTFQALIWPLLTLVVLNVGLGALLGYLGLRTMRELRKRYQAQLSSRRQGEQRAQLEERNRLQTLYAMVETLSATVDYRRVLESTLDICVNAVGEKAESSEMVAAVLLFAEEGALQVGSARGFTATDLRRSFPAENGLLAETLQTGEPRQTSDPSTDAELAQTYAIQNSQSVLCIPLIRGLNAFGVMLFAYPEAGFFTSARQDVLEMIAHQAVIAIQNARLFQEVELEKNRIVESQEETRKKLARDLHDGPTQSVTSIALQVHIARKMLEANPKAASNELSRIEEMAQRTIQEIRHMLFTLRPLALESDGLIPALQQMSDKMRDTFDQNVILDIHSEVVNRMDLSKQTVAFYIVEEAVNNARKHAQASEILARLRYVGSDHDLALLEVIDDGKGFDLADVTSSYDKRGSLGMINLRERAELINSVLHIDTAPGKGTQVQVVIPLTEDAIDRLQRGLVAVDPNE